MSIKGEIRKLDDNLAIRIVVRLAKLGWNEFILDTRVSEIDCLRAKEAIEMIAKIYNIKVDFKK